MAAGFSSSSSSVIMASSSETMLENEGRLSALIWTEKKRKPHGSELQEVGVTPKGAYVAAADGQVEESRWTVPRHPGKRVHVQAEVLKSQPSTAVSLERRAKRDGDAHLRARQDVGVGLDPSDDLTQDDSVRKDVHLSGEEGQTPPDLWTYGFTFSSYSSPLSTSGAIQ